MSPENCPKPSISLDGIKPGNVFHLVNRACKALKEDGHPLKAEDLRARCINDNVKFSFGEVLAMVREVVEVVGEVPISD